MNNKFEEVFVKADNSIREMLDAVSSAEQARLIQQLLEIGIILEDDDLQDGEYKAYVCKNWDKRNDEDFVPEIELGTIYTKRQMPSEPPLEEVNDSDN